MALHMDMQGQFYLEKIIAWSVKNQWFLYSLMACQ